MVIAKPKKDLTKSQLKKELDEAWSKAVKKKAGFKCEVCGKTEHLNSHHIVGRRNRTLRWDCRNGVSLCVSHHKFGLESAHEDPLWFKEWLEDKRWEDYQYLYLVKNTIVKWTVEEMQEKLKKLKEI
jgi:hypothetical protein